MSRIGCLVGPPGTGKTTAATGMAQRWMDRGIDATQVAYLAFTRAAAKTAVTKIMQAGENYVSDEAIKENFPLFRTIHSLAYMGQKTLHPDISVMTPLHMRQFSKERGYEGKFAAAKWEDLSDAFQYTEHRGSESDWDQVLQAYMLSRVTARTVAELDACRTFPGREATKGPYIDTQMYRTFVSKYEQFKVREGISDFTDMLEFAVRSMPPLDHVRYVVIDEAQDLASIHHMIVNRLFPRAEEIWFVGDEDQCQPDGTMVGLTHGGSKPIEEVDVGDEFVSFDRRGASVVGRRSRGCRVTRKSSRSYTGDLFEVTASGRMTRATKEHRFIVRWTKESRRSDLCATYLMEKDGRFRVGWCQLFRADGLLHLVRRAAIEKATRMWVLEIHADRTDASVHESVVASRHGLPTITFEPVDQAVHLTREAIETVFTELGDQRDRAHECLEAHGRSIDHPFWDKAAHFHRKKSTIMEIEACNMLSDIMCVPVYDGTKAVRWEPLTITRSPVRDLRVHSLEVEKHHTYIADGIVTHNCIYSFSGAQASLFLNRYRTADRRIILRKTRRFGEGIVRYSRQIIRRVRDRIVKDVTGLPGRPGMVRFRGRFKPGTGGVLVLHRHVQGCQEAARLFMEQGIPFRNERGLDPLSYGNRVSAWECLEELAAGKPTGPGRARTLITEQMKSNWVDKDGTKTKLVPHGAKKRLEEKGIPQNEVTLAELETQGYLTTAGATMIRDRILRAFKNGDDFQYYDRVVRAGHSLHAEDVPTITTIHGSKGRQANEVVVFSEMSKKCWADPDTEHRLAYVAVTRTETDVTVCGEDGVDWARDHYNYPPLEVAGATPVGAK